MDTSKTREQFEAAVIARFKESGFLEVEIRVECLGRFGDGYQDGSVDAYWHFWKASRGAVVVELPSVTEVGGLGGMRYWTERQVITAVEAQGLQVAL